MRFGRANLQMHMMDTSHLVAAPCDAAAHGGASTQAAMTEGIEKGALTVYVVEDDALLREMVQQTLSLRGFAARGYPSAEALLESGPLRRPCCVVLDVGLPGMGGLQLQQRLQRDYPGLPIVVLTGAADVAVARSALLAGAVDFLLKPADANELLDVVARALASDESRVRQFADLAELQRRIGVLSEREREVFQLVTDGLQNREIAKLFGVSVRTVEAHRANLMHKLKVERAAELFHIRARLDARR
jgi:two-component system response regulator FixJ